MSMARCVWLSLRYMLAWGACLALLGGVGCHKVEQGPEQVFSTITAGMNAAEVEKTLGPGKEVAYDELPTLYRTVLETPPMSAGVPKKGEGVTYRKWSRASGEATATSHIAFRDGKVVDGTVYVETIRTGN